MSAPPPPPPSKGGPPPPPDGAGRARGRAMPPGPPGPPTSRPAGPGQPPIRPGPPGPRPGMPQRPGMPPRPMGPPQSIGRAGPPSGPPQAIGRAGPPQAVGRAGPSGPPSAAGRAMPVSRPGPTPPGRGTPGAPSISPADSQPGGPPGAPSRPGSGGPVPIGRAVYRGEPRATVATPGTGIETSVSELSLSTHGSGAGSGGTTGAGTTGTPQPSVANGAANGTSLGRGATRGFRLPSRIKALEFTRPQGQEWQGKKGTSGTAFKCKANYYRVNTQKEWNLLQYRVDVSPDLDDLKRKKFLVNQHRESKLGAYIFDGTVLFTHQRFTTDGSNVELVSKDKEDVIYKVTISLVGELTPYDHYFLQFFNILLKKCFQELKLEEMNRNYFDPKAKVELPEWKLELWPGYITTMRQHEHNVLLCCETTSKIIRTDTVYDQLKAGARDRDRVTKVLLGAIVLTRYNNKTYRIDEIAWDKKPTDTFPKKDGSEISYLQYYKERYQAPIKDANQPLIMSMPKRSERRAGQEGPVYLVPELCYMTGLSDEQRANFKLMKALGDHTRQAPEPRMTTLMKFSKRMHDTKGITDEFARWKLSLEQNLEEFQARTLAPEQILNGKAPVSYQLENADWGSAFRNFKLFNSAGGCKKWILICAERDVQESREFAKATIKSAIGMGYPMADPKECPPLKNNRTIDYLEIVKKAADMQPQLIMIVIPNNKGDVYHAIKKYLCVDCPVPSQVITATLLKKGKGMMSVATKVAIQIAAKLGAEPWGVKIPMKNTMVVGYDSYHDSSQKGLAVGAVVATMNSDLTRFSSSTTLHRNNDELISQMKACFTNAIVRYKKANGQALPQRILVYRDGLGEGQLDYALNTEIVSMQEVMRMQGLDNVQFAYIIVSKRINARFFQMTGNRAMNPPSGSVVDDVVTLPERHDFFLVSQSVRQGTVNPTSYNIIKNTTQLKPDHIQLLTYKLCHLYYNWPGTVRVPAVCQYAHKLAFLVGSSIHKRPSTELEELLYYL